MCVFFFFKQKTAYEMRISDWSSDVCSSDLRLDRGFAANIHAAAVAVPAVDQRRHVDIQYVAFLELLIAGNAVADDIVERDAAAMRIAAIAQDRKSVV